MLEKKSGSAILEAFFWSTLGRVETPALLGVGVPYLPEVLILEGVENVRDLLEEDYVFVLSKRGVSR